MHQSRIRTETEARARDNRHGVAKGCPADQIDDVSLHPRLGFVADRSVGGGAEKYDVEPMAPADLGGRGRDLRREPLFTFPAAADEQNAYVSSHAAQKPFSPSIILCGQLQIP